MTIGQLPLLLASLLLVPTLVGCSTGHVESIRPGSRLVDIGERRLFAEVEGDGEPTVVFESGGGADGTVWREVAREVREAYRVRTLTYDRAGLGRSDPGPEPYRLEDEADALTTLLDRLEIVGDVVLVAHSYGGWISALVAERDPRVAGVVFVDANLPGLLDAEGISRIQATYRPRYDALRAAYPDLARTLIPTIEAYPASARRVESVRLPPDLPVIDIVAERSWLEHPDDARRARRVHRDFAAASDARTAVLAEGSGHQVMEDRPDVVISAIGSLIERLR